MSVINLKVNGRTHILDVDPTAPLLYILRNDLTLNGPRFGCGLGQCGACTVIIEGEAIRSCITPVATVEGFQITTLEGLGTAVNPHPIQKAFIDQQAAGCGYCMNGMMITAKAFLDQNPKATQAQIIEALDANLCRCATHIRVLKAVQQYQQEVAA
ncbi:MAG: (2Fe-2S)-binding protein [Acidobacteria bacterium]|nr:(2Fe-2S)-binding protein [Acidobacteriota bacterium]